MAIPRANVAKCPVCIQDQRLGCSNGQEVKAGRAYSTVSCSTVIPQGQATFPRTWVAEESRTCTALPLTGDEEGLNLPPPPPRSLSFYRSAVRGSWKGRGCGEGAALLLGHSKRPGRNPAAQRSRGAPGHLNSAQFQRSKPASMNPLRQAGTAPPRQRAHWG